MFPYGISCRSNTKKSGNPVCNFDWTEKCETIESRLAQGLIFSNRDRKGETPLMFLSVTLVVNLHPRLHGQWTCDELFFKSIPHNWPIWADVFGVFPIELSALVLDFLSIYIKLYNIMCFLQKDDIMLHFTLSGSSDITDCQCLLLVYCFVYLESVAGFKFGFKLGFKFWL